MKIQTRDFGETDIQKDEIITFPNGLYAFESQKEFVLLSHEELIPNTYWLQSIDDASLCFILFDPFSIMINYAPIFPLSELSCIDAKTNSELRYLVIGVIPEDFKKSTVNLKSPIVFNLHNNHATQIICENSNYSMRHPLLKNNEEA